MKGLRGEGGGGGQQDLEASAGGDTRLLGWQLLLTLLGQTHHLACNNSFHPSSTLKIL